MTKPSGEHGTNCLALPGSKVAKLLVARCETSLMASGPSTMSSAMW
jgi:hypothetical protein